MINSLKKEKLEEFLIFCILVTVYLFGLFVPLNDNDSAHHATIALNMFLNNNPIDLLSHGEPYLDKPHFQFWLLHLSYILLGVTTFAYKISSFFFTLLTLYSTYKLSKLVFNAQVAKNATLIIATSFAFLMGNVDVRMDAILTGAVIFSIYKVIEYLHNKELKSLILGGLGIAIAFSTKGLFGVGIIGLIILFYTLHKRIFKELFTWKSLLIIPIILVFISPVLYAFYVQFDLHPETIVRGTTGNSGIKFILLDQSFARMKGKEFGESSSNDYFFFFHTLLWSIIPWSLLYCVGVFNQIKKSVKEKTLSTDISLSFVYPILLIYVVMGISKFKLPHYMLPTYPFTAIFIAAYINSLSLDSLKKWNITQNIQYILIAIAAILLNYWAFPVKNHWLTVFYIGLALVVFTKLFIKIKSVNDLVIKGLFASILFWIPFNSNFFPQLLSYQGGQNLAKTANDLNLNNNNVYLFGALDMPYSFDYYTSAVHEFCDLDKIKMLLVNKKPVYLFIEEKDLAKLKENKYGYSVLSKARDYRITVLDLEFINPNTRHQVVTYVYLIKLL